MKKEIKFIVWSNWHQKMFSWEEILKNVEANYILKALNSDDPNEYQFLQYIGLKDKNRKEIYDEYIVKTENEQRYIVQWNQLLCCWGLYDRNGMQEEIVADWITDEGKPPEFWTTTYLEVIGNIYENPELL